MQEIIRSKINNELSKLAKELGNTYSLAKASPLLTKTIRNFILRKGKRVRPLLFCFGYLGFAKKPAAGLFRSCLSLELLHDFMLVHDDIIDRSDTRRGEPSMHKVFDKYIAGFKKIKFTGEDLAIVAADVIYAIAVNIFLSIQEEPLRKENALKKFTQAVIYTGSGEFIELLAGAKDIAKISKNDIYKIYDLKTAYYTFAYPLSIGATLAGAKESEIKQLFSYGACLGRAFQIKDDLIGLFCDEKEAGKSPLTDLQEGKRTILIWYAYNHGTDKDKKIIRRIFSKKKITTSHLLTMRRILISCRGKEFAQREISRLIERSLKLLGSSRIDPRFKNILKGYAQDILN